MPATLQSPGEHQSLDNTMGAMLLGILASSILYGVSLVQAFFYYSRASLSLRLHFDSRMLNCLYSGYRHDPWYMKSLVRVRGRLNTNSPEHIIR